MGEWETLRFYQDFDRLNTEVYHSKCYGCGHWFSVRLVVGKQFERTIGYCPYCGSDQISTKVFGGGL